MYTVSITRAARDLREGTTTSVDMTRKTLDGIARIDNRLHAFVLVDRDAALEAAKAVDTILRSGRECGPLTGVPVGVKDIIHMGGGAEDVTDAYVRTTAPFNLSGQPALSVPCGFDGRGLPVGLQIAGRPFDEVTVLQVGAAYESATSWTDRRPSLHVEAP